MKKCAFILSILMLATGFAAQACECVMPNEIKSQETIRQAYMIIKGRVKSVTPLTQRHGVIDALGPSRAAIEVIKAYDQDFQGTLLVDYQRGGSLCDIRLLRPEQEGEFIIFKDMDNALYIPDTCTDLTPDMWKKMRHDTVKK